MTDFVVVVILVLIVGSALAYIIKSKKNGVKCVGCPYAKSCSSGGHTPKKVSACGHSSKSSTDCSCHTDAEK